MLPKITFGSNANQDYHAFRHLEEAGVNRTTVQSLISNQMAIHAPVTPKGPFNGTVSVNGRLVDYVAFKQADGAINIGRITVRKQK